MTRSSNGTLIAVLLIALVQIDEVEAIEPKRVSHALPHQRLNLFCHCRGEPNELIIVDLVTAGVEGLEHALTQSLRGLRNF